MADRSLATRVRVRAGRIKTLVRRAVQIPGVFEQPARVMRAGQRRDGGSTVLRTRSGLSIEVRHNRWDTEIVAEQFLDKSYLKHAVMTADAPVVVDVGGYIGDFALFCAHELGAQVVVYEPTPENFAVLTRNLARNPGLSVTAVPRGVSASSTITSNVQVIGSEVHASSALYADADDTERRSIECDSLTEVLDRNDLPQIDLLKVDCEGGEYDIFRDVPRDTYSRIRSIVFEWHPTPGYEPRLVAIEADLRGSGFTVKRDGQLTYAFRA